MVTGMGPRSGISHCSPATTWPRSRACQGANSIATIVTHLVGSEMETVRTVVGVASVRDRDEEFRAASLTLNRLRGAFALPTLPPDQKRPGMTKLR